MRPSSGQKDRIPIKAVPYHAHRRRACAKSTTIAACVLTACASLAAAADDRNARIVAAPDAPVRLESAKVLNTGSAPLVLLYAAKNASDSPIDQFTVMVFVFGS